MISLYWICISILFIFILIVLLTKYRIILKDSHFYIFINSSLFSKIIKRILLFILSLFLSFSAIFCIVYLVSEKQSSLHSSFFEELFKFYYNIIPFPKKVCSSYYLEGSTFKCSCYSYKLVDLGFSSSYLKNTSVSEIIREKTWISFSIGIIAYFFECLIGYPLGIFLAKKKHKVLNTLLNILYIIIVSLPAAIYFYLFSSLSINYFKLPIIFNENDFYSYLIPIISVVFMSSLAVAYWVRNYLQKESNKDYIKLAMSKGLNESIIFHKHLLKNACIPLFKSIPSSIVLCFSGFYLLEASFSIPGIGIALINSIDLGDFNLVRGILIFFSFLSCLAYLTSELLVLFLDPRIDEKEVF